MTRYDTCKQCGTLMVKVYGDPGYCAHCDNEREIEALESRLRAAEAKCAEYEDVLRWYGEKQNIGVSYGLSVDRDHGHRAREALAKHKEASDE